MAKELSVIVYLKRPSEDAFTRQGNLYDLKVMAEEHPMVFRFGVVPARLNEKFAAECYGKDWKEQGIYVYPTQVIEQLREMQEKGLVFIVQHNTDHRCIQQKHEELSTYCDIACPWHKEEPTKEQIKEYIAKGRVYMEMVGLKPEIFTPASTTSINAIMAIFESGYDITTTFARVQGGEPLRTKFEGYGGKIVLPMAEIDNDKMISECNVVYLHDEDFNIKMLVKLLQLKDKRGLVDIHRLWKKDFFLDIAFTSALEKDIKANKRRRMISDIGASTLDCIKSAGKMFGKWMTSPSQFPYRDHSNL